MLRFRAASLFVDRLAEPSSSAAGGTPPPKCAPPCGAHRQLKAGWIGPETDQARARFPRELRWLQSKGALVCTRLPGSCGLAHHGLGTVCAAAGVDGDLAEAFGAFLCGLIGRGRGLVHALFQFF